MAAAGEALRSAAPSEVAAVAKALAEKAAAKEKTLSQQVFMRRCTPFE